MFLASALLLAAAPPVAGQTPAPSAPGATIAPVEPELRGELRLDGVPADSGTVVLHRVTPAEAGPVDSVRVEGDGSFRLGLPAVPVPGSGEIYFASARHEGILYFGAPVTDPVQLDSIYHLEMYSTRPAPDGGMPFRISVRNLFVDEGPMGWRVTDLFEIRNDSAVTWTEGAGGGPVWRYPLPPEALSPRVGQSDLADDAVRFEHQAISVHSPVPPGDRLFVIQYDLESLAFTLPLPGHSEFVEVLVEEPAPPLTVEGLGRDQPIQLEADIVYARWSAEDVVDRVARVRLGAERQVSLLPWLGVVLGLGLVAATVWAARQPQARPEGPGGLPEGSGAVPERRRILLELAHLDEAFEGLEEPDPEAAVRYRVKRRELLDELAATESRPAEEDPSS